MAKRGSRRSKDAPQESHFAPTEKNKKRFKSMHPPMIIDSDDEVLLPYGWSTVPSPEPRTIIKESRHVASEQASPFHEASNLGTDFYTKHNRLRLLLSRDAAATLNNQYYVTPQVPHIRGFEPRTYYAGDICTIHTHLARDLLNRTCQVSALFGDSCEAPRSIEMDPQGSVHQQADLIFTVPHIRAKCGSQIDITLRMIWPEVYSRQVTLEKMEYGGDHRPHKKPCSTSSYTDDAAAEAPDRSTIKNHAKTHSNSTEWLDALR